MDLNNHIMKTKILLFIYFLLFSNLVTFAQKTDKEATNSLSLQFSFPSFFQETNFNVYHSNGAKVEIGINPWSPFGLAYDKQKSSGDILSIGIWGMHFNLGTSTTRWLDSNTINNGQTTHSFQSNFMLEYKKRINKKLSSLERFIGIGIYPKIGSYSDQPAISTTYPISVFYTGTDVALILASRYRFSDRFALDISMPVNILSFSYNSIREENPAFPVQQQKTATINIESLKISLRPCFGLVITL